MSDNSSMKSYSISFSFLKLVKCLLSFHFLSSSSFKLHVFSYFDVFYYFLLLTSRKVVQGFCRLLYLVFFFIIVAIPYQTSIHAFLFNFRVFLIVIVYSLKTLPFSIHGIYNVLYFLYRNSKVSVPVFSVFNTVQVFNLFRAMLLIKHFITAFLVFGHCAYDKKIYLFTESLLSLCYPISCVFMILILILLSR